MMRPHRVLILTMLLPLAWPLLPVLARGTDPEAMPRGLTPASVPVEGQGNEAVIEADPEAPSPRQSHEAEANETDETAPVPGAEPDAQPPADDEVDDDAPRLPPGVRLDEPHPQFDGPPLTWAQVIQIRDGVTDRTPHLDEPGWYPLLANAAGWDGPIQPGARVPDYSRIRDNPEAARGHLFLIDGYFLRAEPFRRFQRPHAHLENVQEWVLRLHTDPQHRETVVVYLLDPPEQAPPVMTPVRLSARFYKIHESVDVNLPGRPRAYFPLFVGHSAEIGPRDGTAVGAAGVGAEQLAITIGLLVAAGAALIFFARRSLKLAFSPANSGGLPSRRREQRLASESEEEGDVDDGPPLPEDPVEALRELERRQERDAVANRNQR